MDVRSKQPITKHLQKMDVQERIRQYIQKGRDEASVTISRAAELFSITENKLRDWEEYGFLNPLRPSGPKGRRLYTPSELDKLAIIRELIDAGYAASDIPADIDKLWHTIYASRDSLRNQVRLEALASSTQQLDLPINARIAQAHKDLFWRFFVSRALRLALMAICEDQPNTEAGLIVPLQAQASIAPLQRIEDLAAVGTALVGWLSSDRSSHTFLTAKPSFQYSSDFRIEPLQPQKAGVLQGSTQDNTSIVIQREAKALNLSTQLVETINGLLNPLYEDIQASERCFGSGMRDVLSPATDLDGQNNDEDTILNGLANMVIRLGGLTEQNQPRWNFSCILLPNYPTSILSQQQRSLIVRAQSEHSPYIVGVTTRPPQEPFVSSSIRAFQSGHIIYQPIVPSKDDAVAQQSLEGHIHSTIAVPIEGDDGTAIAVLYVASAEKEAFADNDQRILRMIGRMIRELLETYHTRLHSASKIRALIDHPAITDLQFQDFLSEGDFIKHVELLLHEIQSGSTPQLPKVVSFIAIDIDNQSSIANRYGDSMARDLSRAVGLRIHSQLRTFKDESAYKVYHICADRFFILLKGMTLEQARARAELLKQTLAGPYQIDPHRTPLGKPTLTEHFVTFSNVTVRLGVSSYLYQKLEEISSHYSGYAGIYETARQIISLLEETLALGKQKGGNVVVSWDPLLVQYPTSGSIKGS